MSLIKFLERFPDDETCLDYIKEMRWRCGVYCPFCGREDAYFTNRGYKCRQKECYKKFTDTSGTIFCNTKSSLRVWFLLIYSFASNKKNISSLQQARNIGVPPLTAWRLMTKIRSVFREEHRIQLSGIVEVDEVFVSKGNRWTRWGGISTRKEPILGLIQRGGRVVIKTLESRRRDEIFKIIKEYVVPGSTIYTDGYPGYRDLIKEYNHDWVDHSTHEYVRGEVHTNTIENVWSFLKKGIRNAHHHVSAKYVQSYCDELAFRFNYRGLTPHERFDEILFRLLKSEYYKD